MQLNLRVVLGHLLDQHVRQFEDLFRTFPLTLPLLEQLLQTILVTHEEDYLHNHLDHVQVLHVALAMLQRETL